MKRLLAGLFAASMFLGACNVQSVDEYEKEKARLESEQAATALSSTNETSSVQQQPTETTNEKETTKDERTRNPDDDKETVEKHVEKDEKKVVEDSDKVATPAPTMKKEEHTPATEETTVQQQESKSETATQTENPPTQAADTTDKQQAPADNITSNQKPPTTNAPVTKPTPDNTAKPKPTTPQKEDKKETVTVSVRVDTLLKQEHFNRLPEALQSTKYVPSNGIILKAGTYTIEKGDSAWTATRKALQKHSIHFEYEGEGESGYGSVYVEGINHIYEKQAGSLSGWMFAVNGKAPGVGASAYDVKDGDKITWHYTTNLGRDIGLADQ